MKILKTFEEYHAEFDNLNIKSIAKEFGLPTNDIYELGSGAYGIAYKAGDKVIKLTTDEEEYKNALKLRKKPITKYLINYYDARMIDVGEYFVYVLIMDYVESLSSEEGDLFSRLESLFYTIMLESKSKNDFLNDYIKSKEFNAWCYSRGIDYSKDYIIDRLKQVQEIYKEGKKYKVSVIDTHSGNIGLKDDHYVYFDIGCEYLGGNPRHLKNIDYNLVKYENFINEDINFSDFDLKKVAKEFGLPTNDVEELGGGFWGKAYKVGDKVIKLTTDDCEYKNALLLRKKPITKYLINYYDARKIKDLNYYVLIMDYVDVLRTKDGLNKDRVSLFLNIYSLYKSFRDSDKFNDDKFNEYLENTTDRLYPYTVKYEITIEEIIDKLKQIHGIYKEGKKYNVPIDDIHPGNIGLKDGHYIYFDIGCAYTGGKPKHLKNIDYNLVRSYESFVTERIGMNSFFQTISPYSGRETSPGESPTWKQSDVSVFDSLNINSIAKEFGLSTDDIEELGEGG